MPTGGCLTIPVSVAPHTFVLWQKFMPSGGQVDMGTKLRIRASKCTPDCLQPRISVHFVRNLLSTGNTGGRRCLKRWAYPRWKWEKKKKNFFLKVNRCLSPRSFWFIPWQFFYSFGVDFFSYCLNVDRSFWFL